jgi:pilus assembly protein CpaE
MRLFLIVLSDTSREAWGTALAEAARATQPLMIVGSPAQAAQYLQETNLTPSHIVLDIGTRGNDALAEIDALAQQCEAGTRVIAVGDSNDVLLYRGLLSRGVIDYLPMPASVTDLVHILTAPPVPIIPAEPAESAVADAAIQAPSATPSAMSETLPDITEKPISPASLAAASPREKRVFSFISAGSGDGASTAAVNSAYAIAQIYNGNTVLVDMDYQYGMVAKHLNLQSPYGIRELFDYPDRGIDATLIRRMVANYGKLDVITAPAELRYLPMVNAESIRDLVATLKESYDTIILDLPHVWLPWVASVAQQSSKVVLVSQLWLKSVSHAARLMRVLRELDIPSQQTVNVINRSGAKFKEAVEPRDFERVCGAPIDYTLSNDIRTIITAEASARTVMEMDPSTLATDINRLAHGLCALNAPERLETKKAGLLHRLKG